VLYQRVNRTVTPVAISMGDSMKSRLIMLSLLCFALVATPVFAKEVVTATRIGSDIQLNGTATPTPEAVGNLNPGAWLLGGWFAGDEAYAVNFTPAEQISCVSGFATTTVHMLMDFEATDVPVTFDVQGVLGSQVWDPTAGCYVPGDIDCVGAAYTVTIDVAGTYDLAIPLACDCAYVFDGAGNPYRYYLAMYYAGAFTARVVTDGVQAACTSFNDWGSGWTDLESIFTTYGNINLWGDVLCCENPVSVESETWGGIKSLYR
jgi:hypothetical protein